MTDTRDQKVWFTVPYHIRKLPGMTLALLDFYETIFEFWNKGNPCFLSNSAIMERTGIKSSTTIHDAFTYFEQHNAMKRVFENGRRFIIQVLKVETENEKSVDNKPNNCTNIARGTTPVVGGGTSALVGGGTTGVAHNINKLNASNINKSSYNKNDQKQNRSVDKPKSLGWNQPIDGTALDKWGKPIPSGYVNRDTMSKEAKEAKKGSVKEAEQAMAKLPRHLQPKRLRAGGLDSAPPVV